MTEFDAPLVLVSWCSSKGEFYPCELSMVIAKPPVPPFVVGCLPEHGGSWGITTELPEEPLGLERSMAYNAMLQSVEWRETAIAYRILRFLYGRQRLWRTMNASEVLL